jgi:hypothetical protein
MITGRGGPSDTLVPRAGMLEPSVRVDDLVYTTISNDAASARPPGVGKTHFGGDAGRRLLPPVDTVLL